MTAGERFLEGLDGILGPEPLTVEEALAQMEAQPEEAVAILDRTDRPFTFVAREIARTQLTAALHRSGVRKPGAVVDAWLGPVTRHQDDGRGRGSIEFAPAEPCAEPVDGAEVLDGIVKFIRRFLVADDEAITVMTLWIAMTYFMDRVRVSPILALVSAIFRSGKTRGLEIITLLAYRVVAASNITPSAVFRVVDRFEPTLVVDEMDSFLKDNEELRGVLNSGHTRPLAYVIRTVGDNYEPRRFSTWSAKAVALIGALPPTLTDRSLVVPMRRRKKTEPIQILKTDDVDVINAAATIRSQLARFAEDHPILTPQPRFDELDDRASDNWEPMMAIAAAAGGSWLDKAKTAARALSAVDDEQLGVLLLKDVAPLFEEVPTPEKDVPTQKILAHLHSLDERPWAKYGRRREPIDANQLSRLFRPFNIKPRPIEAGHVRGYRYSEGLADAVSRYVEPENAPKSPPTPQMPVSPSFPQVNVHMDPSLDPGPYDGSTVSLTSTYDGLTGQNGESAESALCSVCDEPMMPYVGMTDRHPGCR